MPLMLILIGAVLVLVAIRNTHGELGQLLSEDFFGGTTGGQATTDPLSGVALGATTKGSVNFFIWLGAIALIGALGWVPALKVPSRILLALVIFGLAATNIGAFSNIAKAIKSPPQAEAPKQQPEAALPDAFPVQVSGAGGGSSGGLGGIAGKAIGGIADKVTGGLLGAFGL